MPCFMRESQKTDVDNVRIGSIMRTSSAAAVFWRCRRVRKFRDVEKYFPKLLDEELGVLHNLASLLLTNRTKRRGADL